MGGALLWTRGVGRWVVTLGGLKADRLVGGAGWKGRNRAGRVAGGSTGRVDLGPKLLKRKARWSRGARDGTSQGSFTCDVCLCVDLMWTLSRDGPLHVSFRVESLALMIRV